MVMFLSKLSLRNKVRMPDNFKETLLLIVIERTPSYPPPFPTPQLYMVSFKQQGSFKNMEKSCLVDV